MKHKQKIGLFGGSFDPVHLAHDALARHALNQFQLDRVIWIPAFISPFKINANKQVAPEQRLAMVRLVCDSEPRFEVSSYEMDKRDISYSVDTLRYFQKVYSDAQFFWILGSDALTRIQEWKEADVLMQELTFLVAGRGGKITDLSAKVKWQTIQMDCQPISSSEIKSGLSQGKYWDQIDPEVAAYIRAHRLYGAAA